MENELSKCPCCGGNARYVVERRSDPPFSYKVLYVQCVECGLQTKAEICDGYYGHRFSKEEAAELWNRRTK